MWRSRRARRRRCAIDGHLRSSSTSPEQQGVRVSSGMSVCMRVSQGQSSRIMDRAWRVNSIITLKLKAWL